MNHRTTRGSLEHCLAQGPRAARLLARFEEAVCAAEMEVVRYWFEDLYRAAEEHIREGHELVSLGFDRRQEWNAGPFMVFNPVVWEGPRRKLLAPTAAGNPRRWVRIQIRSLTKPLRVSQAPSAPRSAPPMLGHRRPVAPARATASEAAAAAASPLAAAGPIRNREPALHD
jgi:hypothetical protein